MKTRTAIPLTAIFLMSTGFLPTGTAQAANYHVKASTSNLSDVRLIGASSVPEIDGYVPFGGLLDLLDPQNWPLMHEGLGSWDPANPTVAPVRGGHNVPIGGEVTIVSGSVTAAILSMATGSELRYGTWQQCTPSNQPWTSCVVSDLIAQNLVWTYDAVNNVLLHQADLPNNTANNPTRTAYCTRAGGSPFNGGPSGSSITGQCSTVRNATSGSGVLSLWNWGGMNANYTVSDGRNVPWNSATNNQLNIGGDDGHAGVIWDMSSFVEGSGGEIKAYVVSMGGALSGINAIGVSAIYTLDLVPVPIPAAVWLFGGALGLLSVFRRR